MRGEMARGGGDETRVAVGSECHQQQSSVVCFEDGRRGKEGELVGVGRRVMLAEGMGDCDVGFCYFCNSY